LEEYIIIIILSKYLWAPGAPLLPLYSNT